MSSITLSCNGNRIWESTLISLQFECFIHKHYRQEINHPKYVVIHQKAVIHPNINKHQSFTSIIIMYL